MTDFVFPIGFEIYEEFIGPDSAHLLLAGCELWSMPTRTVLACMVG
jgi:hypothetical protein